MNTNAASANVAGMSASQRAGGRSAAEFHRAQAHSDRVRRLKIALPVLAVVMGIVFVAYSGLSRSPAVSVDLGSSGIEDGKLVMANPKLDGFTKNNQPYSMRAKRAIQEIGNTNLIALETIDASIPVDESNTAKIDADNGTYDNAANTLDIDSPLTVTTTDGMIAKLKSAFIEIQSGNLTTDKPVDIQRGTSRLSADSMTIEDRGKVLVFENRVRLTILPNDLKKDSAESKVKDETN